MMKNKAHLIIDANETPSVMRCLDCGDSHPLVQTRLTTAIYLMKAFEDAHNEMGCSEESYLKKKLLKDIEPIDILETDTICPDCKGLVRIRNPTGKCDHLHYPEYKEVL